MNDDVILSTMRGLTQILNLSTDPLVQRKTKAALTSLRAARTLLDKAAATLTWAQAYKPSGGAR